MSRGVKDGSAAAAAGVVLAGGRSRRMGTDKVSLRLGGEAALLWVVRALGGCGPVVVVAAAGQDLPPSSGHVVRDELADAGPLAALALGLRTAASLGAESAVVCAVDTPLLHPAVAQALLRCLGPHDAAVPEVGGRVQPLLAAYRTDVAPVAERLLATGQRRLQAVLTELDVRGVSAGELSTDPGVAAGDPALRSFASANTPAEWATLTQLFDARPAHAGSQGFLDSTK
ncbi:MAG: molybdenum cofactor guanylyltransferase [Mycobacteriaceae bacterium]